MSRVFAPSVHFVELSKRTLFSTCPLRTSIHESSLLTLTILPCQRASCAPAVVFSCPAATALCEASPATANVANNRMSVILLMVSSLDCALCWRVFWSGEYPELLPSRAQHRDSHSRSKVLFSDFFGAWRRVEDAAFSGEN